MPFGEKFKPENRKRTLSPADKKRIAASQDWRCNICGETLPARFHIDHIKEFSNGGSDIESNLQALCPNCHSEKTENDRHRHKQIIIKDKEGRKNASDNPFSSDLGGGGSFFGETSNKGRKKKSNNPFSSDLRF